MKIKLEEILLYFCTIDLVLGGTGHLISIGGLSIRIIIMLLMLVFEFIIATRSRIKIDKIGLSICVFLLYLVMNSAMSMFYNDSGIVLDKLFAYLPIILFVFFANTFSKKQNLEVEKYIIFFEKLCFILAVFTVLLWGYCFVFRTTIYTQVNINFLQKYIYGDLSFLGNMIPRLWLKASAFTVIGYTFSLNRVLNGEKTKRSFVKLFIYVLSVIVTFTVGFYIGMFFSTLIVLKMNKKKVGKIILLFFLFLIAILTMIYKFNLVDIFMDRFSSNIYSVDYKWVQLKNLLDKTIESPVFGKGLGYEMSIDYGFGLIKTTSSFEVMWGEILMNLGIVGLIIFINILLKIIKRLFIISKELNQSMYGVLAIGIINICIISCFNPFMNNSIGLLYLVICYGITDANYRMVYI